jgi:hypothetical protein
MKFYFVNAELESGQPYFGTSEEAKRAAREAANDAYDDVKVERVEVATDRAAILNLLNVGTGAHVSVGIIYTAKAKKKD